MKLDDLFSGLPVEIYGEGEVSGASAHSKSVKCGDLFIARSGAAHKGTDFIDEAVAGGASAIFTDLYNPFLNVPQVVGNVGELMREVVARLYDHPEKKLTMIGVTGTNGKTTTAFLIHHLLQRCGMIGTIEYRIGEAVFPATLTTPDVVMTYRLLGEMVRAGCTSCVMEVSSHALEQGRVDGIEFNYAIFTNLSQDHLDYHGSMENYFAAKKKLFAQSKMAIVNRDDPWGKKIGGEVIWYGKHSGKMPLAGEFNRYNVAAAIEVAKRMGVTEIEKKLKTFTGVPGRMEKIENDLGIELFVDFAHTPDAFECVLSALKNTCRGKLRVVFGCGGDRDREKRSEMGRVAKKWSDVVYVTSDNPRGEDPLKICREIGVGEITVDRKEAIGKAILEAGEGDTVAILGRGHESFQILGAQRIPLDDRLVAKDACANREKLLN